MTVDGLEIAYRRAGAGPPALLLHGIATSSRLWDAVGAELAPGHEVVAPDLVGFGASAKPDDRDVSMSAQARLVPMLLDALGLDRVLLVGHDIGGAAAQWVAVDAPDRVAGLVLIDSVSFDSWPILRMRALRALAPPVARRWPRLWFRWFEGSMRRYVPAGPGREGLSASLGAWATGPEAADAFLRNARAMDPQITQDVARRLREIAAPTHIVWGRRDPFQKVRWAPRLRDAIPGSTLTVLDGGHFLPWELPREVAHEIRELGER